MRGNGDNLHKRLRVALEIPIPRKVRAALDRLAHDVKAGKALQGDLQGASRRSRLYGLRLGLELIEGLYGRFDALGTGGLRPRYEPV